MKVVIRPINPRAEEEILLVATRMRDTLVEVLGEEKGGSMYTIEWLTDRARWHLDPANCIGEIFLAESENDFIAGHSIVRIESDESGKQFGLFSTTYIEPGSRGKGLARMLIKRGEEWMIAKGMTKAYTYTEVKNEPLKKLFIGLGYEVEEIKSEFAIIAKSLQA